MKLVDVECNFEGTKTMFFFTSDGRVDFRELVKDLASVFRNRIELRQIGVRDEAKMIGGIGMCGRPYCCSQFLDDFQPVSTKMAKVQSLSLNPTKISGSCGRLMCCLRYEQEAYEDLIKKVPKQGAFVETKDGYGTAVQVNLLRQTVKVKLDDDGDDSLRLYKPNELCAVPGGRPKDGEKPVKAGGRLIVIDGGFCKVYQPQTGIAGYTLIYNSHGIRITSHEPFGGVQDAIRNNKDILSTSMIFETRESRIKIADTDDGRIIREKIEELRQLLAAYQAGLLKEEHGRNGDGD